MNRALLSSLLLLAVLSGCSGGGAPEAPPVLGPPVRIQVLPDQSGQVTLRSDAEVKIETLPDLVLRFRGSLPEPAAILPEAEGFRLDGRFYPSPLRLVAAGSRPLSLRGGALIGPSAPGAARSYRGALDLINVEGRTRAINEVSLEEYLASVVGGEMPRDFPAAALECQAIASRTYVLYNLRAWGARRLARGFPADSTFQVYPGLAGEHPGARRAVQSTAGWVLTYQGKVFPAYFHSTCGGSTTSAAWIFGDGADEIPPLRGVPCQACSGSPTYRWSLTLSLRQVEDLLRPWAEARKVDLGELSRLSGLDPLPGGYLRYVKVEHSRGSFEMRADRFVEALRRGGVSGLRSASFEVGPGSQPGTIVLRGAGWGHGVGMCQHGVARRGKTAAYGEILAYYFPESELKKLY